VKKAASEGFALSGGEPRAAGARMLDTGGV